MTTKRARGSDTAAGVGVLLGLLAAFLPWYSYTGATARVTVDAFRASVLGDVFFLAIAAAALIVLMRSGIVMDALEQRMSQRRALFAAAGCAGAAVLLQLILVATGGRSVAVGMLIAVLATAVLLIAAGMLKPAIHRLSDTTRETL